MATRLYTKRDTDIELYMTSQNTSGHYFACKTDECTANQGGLNSESEAWHKAKIHRLRHHIKRSTD